MAEQTLRCKVHIENQGWSDWFGEGRFTGTTGKGLRLEAIIIEGVDEYRVHIENIGWSKFVKSGEVAGTTGKGLRIEAIEIKGKDINYRVHVQNTGWLNWAVSGEMAGTTGGGLRIEAIQLIESAEPLGVDDTRAGINITPKPIPVPPIDPHKPVQSLAGKVICLNPGHGGSDPGAVGNIRESDANLRVVLTLGKLLTERGARVVYTRTSDVWMALSTRAAIANNANADLFISVHHNGASSPTAHGTETICYPGSTLGIKLATLTLNGICNRLGTYRRGVIKRDDSDVTFTNMPAVITEGFFVTNPTEVAKFNDGGAELEAQGIIDGILEYFK